MGIKNQIPMYEAWVVKAGGHEVSDRAIEYGAVNSKAAACLHVRYRHAKAGAWPLVVRVLCPSGAIHEVTVDRVVEYDYKPKMVVEIKEADRGPR